MTSGDSFSVVQLCAVSYNSRFCSADAALFAARCRGRLLGDELGQERAELDGGTCRIAFPWLNQSGSRLCKTNARSPRIVLQVS
jgi:hypothetical protein